MSRFAFREAVVAIVVWATALIYTTVYCGLFGYGRNPGAIRFIWGIPDWVLWGVLAPWGVCHLVTLVYAFGYMRDESLDPAPNDRPTTEDAPRA